MGAEHCTTFLRDLEAISSLIGGRSETVRSLARQRPVPLRPGARACNLAIDRAVCLLPRSAGSDRRSLAVDVAKADIAVGPCWTGRDSLTIYLTLCGAGRACNESQQQVPPRSAVSLFRVTIIDHPIGKSRQSTTQHVMITRTMGNQTTKRRGPAKARSRP
jgi:hypothetical protein